MRIEGEKLGFIQNLFEEAKNACSELYDSYDKYMKQYKGSRDVDPANPGDAPQPATVVRNITYELIESQVTGYIPTPCVTPKEVGVLYDKNAAAIETLLKNKRDELPFEKLNDIDERYNPIYGGSVWLAEWDDSVISNGCVGDVKISCLPPSRFYGQPHIYDINDMEYCFVTFETTKDDLVRKYGVSYSMADETENDRATSDDKTATVILCYYKNDDDKVCEFIYSDDTVLLDIDDYYSRKRHVCKVCGCRKEACKCENPSYKLVNEKYETIDADIVKADGSVLPAMSPVIKLGQTVIEEADAPILDEFGTPVFDIAGGMTIPMTEKVTVPKTEATKIPFYVPKKFPICIRKNTSAQDCVFGQSDCEFIRPQQQAINKIESRILTKLMRAGVYPIVPENKKGHINLGDSILEDVIGMGQEDIGLYNKLDLQCDISRDIMQADRLYDHAKRILGISDSYQGQYDSSAQSGKAKQIQIQQSSGRLDSKRQMKNAAYAELDEVIFELYLAYADEPRSGRNDSPFGTPTHTSFSRYDFVERDNYTGEYYYNDGYMFRTDASADIEKNKQQLWEETRANYQSGTFGDPALYETKLMYWQIMEKYRYPLAKEVSSQLKAQAQAAQAQAQVQMEAQAPLQNLPSPSVIEGGV